MFPDNKEKEQAKILITQGKKKAPKSSTLRKDANATL